MTELMHSPTVYPYDGTTSVQNALISGWLGMHPTSDVWARFSSAFSYDKDVKLMLKGGVIL